MSASRAAAGKALIAGGAALLIATAVQLFLYNPEPAVAPPSALAGAAVANPAALLPTRIAIPKLALSAKVDRLGLVAGNRMQAPANFTDVGWFKYGVAPGEPGVAVMYAHLDNGLGLNGVFKNLDELQVGDEVEITDASSTVRTFKVSNIETYPYLAVPRAAIGEDTASGDILHSGPARVVLITCAGAPTRDPTMGFTYDHRLVVTATLVS